MNNQEERERASTYFNSIIRRGVEPQTVADLAPAVLEGFNGLLAEAFTDDAPEVIHRVHYLVPYILGAIDWNEYGIPLQAWQLQYYYRRERFLEKTGLDYGKFVEHRPLQDSIAALGLDPEPTFEFILFLKYYYGMRSELRYTPAEQLGRALEAMRQADADAPVSIDISVGGKHFPISNSAFVRRLLEAAEPGELERPGYCSDFSEGSNRDKIRALDYYMVKTLLDYLPVRRDGTRRGQYTQDERNFGLSVLNFCGRLPDIDREGTCSRENNATFDKLMRDFKNIQIPFAMELFL